MIHIATVHYLRGNWIEVQQRYLRKHLKSPFRIYAWFNEVTPPSCEPFFFTCFEPITEHEIKLNILGDIICHSAESGDDILIFLDGDAFPIADLEPFLAEKLPAHSLAAVQRLENNGDTQPHPCFCATTVGLWKKIKGDWKRGHEWKNAQGRRITDPGGNLLKQLEGQQINWYPLVRSNRRNLHPVLFGIYDSLIYHHGAGFRNPMTRLDEVNRKANGNMVKKALSILPWYRSADRRKLRDQNILLSDDIFYKIHTNGDFFRELM